MGILARGKMRRSAGMGEGGFVAEFVTAVRNRKQHKLVMREAITANSHTLVCVVWKSVIGLAIDRSVCRKRCMHL